MISGLDSAYAPSAAQVIAANTAGHRAWAGYFAGPNILNGWAWSDFQRVRAGGLATWAYVSGLADPAAMRAQSDLWGVPICLDVEGGIRGFGAWVQPWLAAATPCGLYGNPPIHASISAAFHVCAAYPGYEPTDTWPAYIMRPTTPCAWQWRGSHNEFGVTVDSVWADDAFAAAYSPGAGTIGGDDLSAEDTANIKKILQYLDGSHLGGTADPNHPSLDARVEEIYKEQRGEFQFDVHSLVTGAKVDPAFTASLPEILKAIKAIQSASGGLTQQQVTDAVTAALKTLTLKAT